MRKKDETATAPAEATERAQRGSSPQAKAKGLILILADAIPAGLAKVNADLSLEGKDAITLAEIFGDEGISEEFTALAAELATISQRGLPLATRLENVQKEVADHWANMPVKDGRAVVTAEWQEVATSLLKKQGNVERAIREAKKKAEGGSETESAEAATN